MQPELAALAVECAADLGVELDGSRASVEHVEDLLGRLHDEYKRRPNEEGADRRAFEFAAYLIGVFEADGERGEWRRDHPERGEGSFPFRWRGRDHFVVDWCWTRIVEGPKVDVRERFETALAGE
ncbi:MAG: hypothetical protein L6Q99_17765 [Planctomycetes bacterium]|nr:hypothetical protein [Planctomycetota bacterium]